MGQELCQKEYGLCLREKTAPDWRRPGKGMRKNHEIYLDHHCRLGRMGSPDQQTGGASLISSLRRIPKKPAISGSRSSSGSAKPFSQLETVPRIRLKSSSQLARGIPFRSLRILNLVPKLMGSPPFVWLMIGVHTGNLKRTFKKAYYLFATAFVIAIIELSYKECTVKKHLSPLCVRGLSVILGLKGRKLV